MNKNEKELFDSSAVELLVNNGEYNKALKLIKKLRKSNKENVDLYLLEVECWYYLFKEKKGIKVINKTDKLTLTNKQKNQKTALLEALTAKVKKENKAEDLVLYKEEELTEVEKFIEKNIGKFDNVLHEMLSYDLHIDVAIIPPTKKNNYYTISTIGMGAHKMNVPSEFKEYNLDRAELVMHLPPNWQITSDNEIWYWPIRWIKSLARLPLEHNTWLSNYHTIPSGRPFSTETELNGVILLNPTKIKKNRCMLPNEEVVNFYEVFPLYKEEMDYKLEHGAEELFYLYPSIDTTLSVNRKSFFDLFEESLIDDALTHVEKAKSLNLEIDLINCYSHLAIYLRWCVDNNLTSDYFNLRFFKQLEEYKNGNTIDFREILLSCQHALTTSILNEEGVKFTKVFYVFETEKAYPHEIDKYTEKYFNDDIGNPKYKNEEYLFLPYDEDYYNHMKKVINKNYKKFKTSNS